MDRAKLFQNGRSQAVRLPKDFRLPGTEVYVKRVGNAVVLIPVERSWDTLFDSLGKFTDDFMADRNQPRLQERAQLFD
jgi:antitoxin VapB